MATLPNSKTVTYEEWLRMPEVTDAIEEVVNGEIRIMPPASSKHAFVIDNLDGAFRAQRAGRPIRFLTGSFGLIIRKVPLSSRVPALALFEKDTIVEQDGYIHSAPQLIVEVLSPANTRRERQEKLADYSSLGVPEVWVVSLEARTVEVLLLKSGDLETDRVLLQLGTLTPARFPEVHIEIASIWPD